MSYFFKLYREKILWDIYYKYKLKNFMNVPYLYKVVLNSSCGRFFSNKKFFDSFYSDFYNICLQKPLIVKSKKSISEFKIKKNDNISIKITLRKNNMYNFIGKFLIFSMYNMKNFKGFPKTSFDNFGNYNFGINDYSIFLESSNSFLFNFLIGLDVNIVIKNSNIEKSLYLLNCFNFLFF